MFSPTKRFSIAKGELVVRNRASAGGRASLASSGTRSTETAGIVPFLVDAGAGVRNSVRMTASGPLAFNYMLTGIVPEHEETLRRYYRDIYVYDNVAGSAVDMISMFPFSEWTLTGADRDILKKYEESLFRLNLRSLLPEISTSYLVDGMFIGTLVFNHIDKVFIDILLHNPDDCKIEPSPFYSNDPQITVINNEQTRRFMASRDKWAQRIKKTFANEFINALQHSAYELNPMTTLYLPRRTLPSRPPTSFLKRILPIYLLEKQLYRGTLVEAHKRQRSMLHVTAGDDNWEPTPEELEALVGVFQQAELDPLGAIIATRTSVTATEMRQGGDFWKWTDQADTLVPYKLRALGISEAFLSQDATFSNAETAMSVFMENMDAYRRFIQYRIFENRIFPIVAVANGFYKDESKAPDDKTKNKLMYALNNQNNLVIPKMSWHKSLEAKKDDNPMDMLTQLSEKGIPIPLRMWAAAAKVDLDTLLYELDQDKHYRDIISKYKTMLDNSGGEDTDIDKGEGEEGGGDYNDESDMEEAGLKLPFSKFNRRRIPLLARNFGESGEVRGKTKTGKDKYVYNQRAAQEAANRLIAKAAVELKDPNRRAVVKKALIKKLGGVPNIIGMEK